MWRDLAVDKWLAAHISAKLDKLFYTVNKLIRYAVQGYIMATRILLSHLPFLMAACISSSFGLLLLPFKIFFVSWLNRAFPTFSPLKPTGFIFPQMPNIRYID